MFAVLQYYPHPGGKTNKNMNHTTSMLWYLVFLHPAGSFVPLPLILVQTLWPNDVEETGATQHVLRQRISTFQGGTFRNDSPGVFCWPRKFYPWNPTRIGTASTSTMIYLVQKNLEICKSGLSQSCGLSQLLNLHKIFHRFGRLKQLGC